MGAVFGIQGNEKKELEHKLAALQANERLLGKVHLEVADCLNSIGVYYWRRARYNLALEHYRKALDINVQILGCDHPQVANYQNNIGLVLWKKGEYQQAHQSLQKALTTWENTIGKEHPLLAWPLYGLGGIYLATGKNPQAKETLLRLKEICAKSDCHPEPEGMAYFGLAKLAIKMEGDQKQSISLARKAREIYAKTPKFRREIEEIDQWIGKLR